jgi:hypothetical protein
METYAMIENNPGNVSSGFETLLEKVETEIDFFTHVGSHAFEKRDFRTWLTEGRQP